MNSLGQTFKKAPPYKKAPPLIKGQNLLRGGGFPIRCFKKLAAGGKFWTFGLLTGSEPFRKRLSERGKRLENTKNFCLRRARYRAAEI